MLTIASNLVNLEEKKGKQKAEHFMEADFIFMYNTRRWIVNSCVKKSEKQ